MKILYLCGLYSEELRPVFSQSLRKGRMQDAANIFQHAVLEGLAENNADFTVLSYPFLPCYPHNFRRLTVPGGKIRYCGNVVGDSMPYKSLVLYKPYSIKHSIRSRVSEWIKQNIKDNERFTVLLYSYEYYFLEPLLLLKKQYPEMQIAAIVTDLADNAMAFKSNRSLLKRIQLCAARSRTKRCIKCVDKFIILTPYMVEKLPEAANNNIVIEGIYHNSDDLGQYEKLPKTLLYAGSFQEFAGVRLLVDAFMATKNPSFRLILCGSGPCDSYIDLCAKHDPRIENRGRVSRDEVIRLQKSVALLVNPRQPNGGITKYSFPSKTMEYMSSGTPMIGYRLEGMPDEYFQYIEVPDDLTADALTRTIEKVLSQPDEFLSAKGESARSFILQNKSAKIQVARLMDFLCKM